MAFTAAVVLLLIVVVDRPDMSSADKFRSFYMALLATTAWAAITLGVLRLMGKK